MDEQSLIPADPVEVMRRMAQAYLASPTIVETQGEIRLAPHQVEAAARLLRLIGEHGGAVLADATGLGKTFVAIAVARVLGPALVVAPAALRSMWRDALRRTGVEARIESYEALSRGRSVSEHPALLVLDEAHHARNARARRYAALADLAWGANVLLLTATPIHNRGRDLRALVALFLGSRADTITDDELRRVIVRRPATIAPGAGLPTVAPPQWLAVPTDPDTLQAIRVLPQAVPAADGETAHALLQLGLIRAWSSSAAALRETLLRRLRRAASLAAALESGRVPDRRELNATVIVDDAIQLGFPDLFAPNQPAVDIARVRDGLERHVEGARSILRTMDNTVDDARQGLLKRVRASHRTTQIVAFTQFADTANTMFRGSARAGVAMVTGAGARIASGRVNVDEIVRGFDDVDRGHTHTMPLELLITTDVLSEGLSLRRAGAIVHLDLPWTLARLEQRVGRLRRMGSPHEQIAVYAIGPPVEARELLPVVRALQRKTRLSGSITGLEELHSSLPLLGNRLVRATRALGRRNSAGATEELRRVLADWIDASDRMPRESDDEDDTFALGLVDGHRGFRLIAVHGHDVSGSTAMVLRAVRSLSGTSSSPEPDAFPEIVASIELWLEEERGRVITSPVTETPSPAHISILRALQGCLVAAPRWERSSAAVRIEAIRSLVLSARGIGAERALDAFARSGPLNLDALGPCLASRVRRSTAQPRQAGLVAVLCRSSTGCLAAYVRHNACDQFRAAGLPDEPSPLTW